MARLIAPACLLAACVLISPLRAAGPEFEVASVKPSPEINRRQGMTTDKGHVDIAGLPLSALLPLAYRVPQSQVKGPDWMISERFDISAKLPEGASEDQIPEMLQALLADRFKLAVHRETKEQPGYALTVAKSGLKIKEASPEDAPAAPVPVDPSATFNSVVPLGRSQVRITENPGGHGGTITGPSTGTVRELAGANGAVRLEALSISSGGLTDLLTMLLRQPVMDMTELKGRYQLVLEINVNDMVKDAQERGQQAQVPFDPSVPIIAAVQKLGLKLEQRKMPVETIVVDHLEKTPTEN